MSQHDDVAEEMHRPVRRRKPSDADAASQASALQLVETQAAPATSPTDDELPHRTKPRRRRGAAPDAEPLKLVETQKPGDISHPDTPINP